jgi:glycosyltransferase involved in cell wall biosynthesis
MLEKRRIDGLSSSNVRCLLGPFLEVLLRPVGKIQLWNDAHDFLASLWMRLHRSRPGVTIVHGFQESCRRTLRASRHANVIRILEITAPPLLPECARYNDWQVDAGNFADVPAMKRELAEADFVLVQSEFSARAMIALGIPTARILRQHLGVDTREFFPRQGHRSPGSLRVVFMGSIGRRKGVHHLLEAWRQLNLSGAELFLMGNSGSPQATELLANAPSGCRILGFVPDAERLERLRDADVFVHPSLAEGGCNAVYEALACGIPCVVSSNAGSAVRDGQDGFVFEAGDIDGMSSALRRVLTDSALRASMAASARTRAEELAWDTYSARLGRLYRDLAETRIAGSGRLSAVLQAGF